MAVMMVMVMSAAAALALMLVVMIVVMMLMLMLIFIFIVVIIVIVVMMLMLVLVIIIVVVMVMMVVAALLAVLVVMSALGADSCGFEQLLFEIGMLLHSLKDRLAGDLIASGIDFVLCTGRGIGTIPKPLYGIKGLRYAVTGNGAMVWDLKKDIILRERRIDPKLAKAVIRSGRSFGIAPAGYQHGIAYLDTFCPEPRAEDNFAMKMWLKNARRSDLLKQVEKRGPLDKILLFDNDPEKRNAFRALIQEMPYGSALNYAESGVNALEITADGATKGEAALWLAEYLGCSKANILCAGDNDNDITMLKIACISVVPRTGTKEAKAQATVLVPPPSEDGVENYLRELMNGPSDLPFVVDRNPVN